MSRTLAVVSSGILLCAVAARAQTPGCVPQLAVANTLPGVDYCHDVVAWDPDGPGPATERIVVAGGNVAGNLQHWGIAIFDPATGEWSTPGAMPPDPTATSMDFRRLAAVPGGPLYAATIHDVYRFEAGSWNHLGRFFDATGTFVGPITSMVARSDGELFVAGDFGSIHGVVAHSVARFDGQWHALGTGLSSGPDDLQIAANGDVVAGGAFGPVGGPWHPLAIWNGTSWNHPTGASGQYARSVTTTTNGDVWFAQAWGVYRYDGAAWSTVGIANQNVRALRAMPDDSVVALGLFTTMSGVPANRAARFVNGAWQAIGEGASGVVQRASRSASGHLCVSGSFRTIDGRAAAGVAVLEGSQWSTLGVGFDGHVRSLVRLANGDVLAAGDFVGLQTAEGTPADRIARRDDFGWHALGRGFSQRVRDVAELPNGDIVAVGDFLFADGTRVDRVARWDGSAWHPLGAGASGNLHAVVALPNGDVVVAGFSHLIGGRQTGHIARWDGSAWHDLDGGVGELGAESLLLLPNGDLLAGGPFTTVGGVVANGVARWDGATWHALGGGSPTTFALHLEPAGTVLAASAGALRRWDGTSWQFVAPNGTVQAGVATFADLPGGDLLTGGPATTANAVLPGLHRWPGGTSIGRDLDGAVRALLVRPDGSVLVGGDFVGEPAAQPNADRWRSPFLAELRPGCPADATSIAGGCVTAAGGGVLTAEVLPWLGGTSRTRASGLPTGALFAAVRALQPNFVALPFHNGPGCYVLLPDDHYLMAPTTTGEAVLSLSIPNVPALLGLTIYEQVAGFAIAPNGSIADAFATNALRLTIGAF